LHSAAEAIHSTHPNLHVQVSSVRGEPRRALRSESESAALTVVGTRGRGRIPEVVLGSIALYVAAHARSAVAVVPPTVDNGGADPQRPVLLAADGTEESEAAVAFAFDEAAVRDVDLVAITVWDDPALRTFAITAPMVGMLEDQEEQAVLGEQLAGWSDKYPDVRVRKVVLRGRPAEQLLAYRVNGKQPALIVVGCRGHGGAAGLVLGSTSQRLITAAQVPIIVVRKPSHH
jgi:nucleotide-binding universal stress UspA family protein